MLEAWQNDRIYEKLSEKSKGKPSFVLHDGPPFSNGNIHMGHSLNKILKDFVNRYKAMSGYRVVVIPGWDNHGMPIESAIIKKNRLNRKEMTIPEFRSACKAFAEDFVNKQREQFMRLGVLADWEHPYLTMNPSFEAEEIKVFGEMYKKGYIYKGLKPVYWCPSDETALAEAEIEYQDDDCKSIYVKFKMTEAGEQFKQYCDTGRLYVIIWTTTAWSLPGNLAVAIHPREEYAIIKADNGEYYITAAALAERTMKAGKIENYEIVHTFKGAELEFAKARHPFLDRDSVVVLADYVTMDSGTGCVHTAPCHGMEDFITGQRYKLPDIMPINDRGIMTEQAGKYCGMYYEKAAEAILEDLAADGTLFAIEHVKHSYPHCWRCKKPVIYRATAQWFCSVESFKQQAIDQCENVKWMPEWGGERIVSMIRDRADWCISRQRHWGLPIPVFYCRECGKPVCTDQTIDAVSKMFAENGSNSWYERTAEQILPDGFKCPFCGHDHFEKETDTLDGWFDSGSTHRAVLGLMGSEYVPADLYLEGADQYRGWFQSSMLTAVATTGKAPYKAVITHGWTVDGEGKKMSKSLGNGVEPADIIKKYGADILRLWVASSDYRADVRVSDAIFAQLSQAYLKIRNTARYILGNLNGFDPDQCVDYADMTELDKWALMRLNRLVKRVTEAYENYEYHAVYHSIHNFCVVDMSNFYLDVIKDVLYCEQTDGILRRSAQTAIFKILDALVRMISPVLAFTAEEIWQAMPHRADDDRRYVLFNDMPKYDPKYEFTAEQAEKWDKIILLRDNVNRVLEQMRNDKKIGKSLEARIVISADGANYDLFKQIEERLPSLLIVSQAEVQKGASGEACEGLDGVFVRVYEAKGGKCVRCWNHSEYVGTDNEHPELCRRCAEVVAKQSCCK